VAKKKKEKIVEKEKKTAEWNIVKPDFAKWNKNSQSKKEAEKTAMPTTENG
jgi:hypothetical protein